MLATRSFSLTFDLPTESAGLKKFLPTGRFTTPTSQSLGHPSFRRRGAFFRRPHEAFRERGAFAPAASSRPSIDRFFLFVTDLTLCWITGLVVRHGAEGVDARGFHEYPARRQITV